MIFCFEFSSGFIFATFFMFSGDFIFYISLIKTILFALFAI
ncbi:hypothetical protein LEP1GSC020_4453 [Leptospira interrogans serovar Grippotyphosa str. 2006006986]|uniref:Uncharacterized protein n=3 Tax=Leptospira interrogans TaxID=173 RepID=A0A0F6I9G9_LEPIR|nr:hypothetical protein G436_1325 [Leptospira interrogans serovar Hardjo str. Norma]EKO88659.1 hypothetical protein LEP1GSC009_1026 [Leptospira interrogans serovar Grippotyphosa str. Andaman]EKO95795.1 hypothetical protein LEP1GSC057_0799 [Leptospira interrogans str. Brem 329]EKP84660.1 hypothetical protein LEP1GSC020_4453 [Leptospira interrogans serovar Grippotyphosa str. 2006006986]EMF42805.1 hypothetical protein LEP1GSC067_0387 [Leptospira interrogans serovar Lora str. TE 1992]EMJ34694.1 hy